ncbi:MAG: exonuclease domain-containing protein [Firmicutes bacterium]|nr:exonuclease domain-containing protein [Bacillota bacterium]
MNYIVLDLEWNQSQTDTGVIPELVFEIIEIGAVMLNDSYVMIHEFSRLVKPEVYHEMNQITGKLVHLQMKELQRGVPFVEAAGDFLKWCGTKEYIFCTWGSMDLTEFQRNMQFYDMTPLSDGPIAFLDVQKLFSLAYEDGKSRHSLEYAVDMLGLEKDIPFHRAFSDAYYTAKLLKTIGERHREVMQYVSYDVFHLPAGRKQEIKVRFDNYAKYISREFESKEDALADGEVMSSKCYLCCRNVKRKVKWFTPNGRNYYCAAYCEKHGYLKAKARVRKSESGKVYIVKTTKFISQEDAAKLKNRSALVKRQNARRR